jgi:CHAT domain-containing protein
LDKLVDPTYSDELIAQNLRDSINTLEENKFNLDYLFSMNPTDSLKRIKTAVEAEILSYQTKLKSLRSFNPSKIADVAQLLKNPTDETFYYQFGDSSLYLLYLSPEGNHLKEISEKIELVKLLSAYDKNLKAGRTMTFDKSLSSQLFQILFSDYYSGQEQMTIVPHGELSFLPFESLMTSNGKFLVEESSLSYAISLTLQQEWRKTKGKVKEIHVISPIYDSIYMETNESKSRGSINFDFLAYSQMEAKNIAELLDANLIEEATVDKELVKNSMATADIFHFSGHSYLTENDNQFTFMALGHNYTDPDHTFSVAEVFHQDTHAEMVFLNACNTAKSDLINGEGVYNLSRAFLSSGSKSVVSTLWEVDDKASGEISIVFYENLKDGMSKANALQQAKNNYLQNVTKDNQRHPYYWAGIVLVGNPDSLTFHNNSLTYILAAIGILLLGGIWFLKKRSIHPG